MNKSAARAGKKLSAWKKETEKSWHETVRELGGSLKRMWNLLVYNKYYHKHVAQT